MVSSEDELDGGEMGELPEEITGEDHDMEDRMDYPPMEIPIIIEEAPQDENPEGVSNNNSIEDVPSPGAEDPNQEPPRQLKSALKRTRSSTAK